MFSPRIALTGVASGALLTAALAAPAYAAPVSDVAQMTCFQAQTALTNAQHSLVVAQAADRSDDNGAVNGSADFTPDAADLAVTAAQATVSTDQGYVNALCGTSTIPGPVGNPFPHPHPWPTPIPGPVGLPLLNCSQLAARGIHDIPASSAWYRTALDANGDGIGCETNLNTYRVVNGQKCHLIAGQWIPVTTVTAPCTACSSTVSAPPPVIYQSPPVYVAPAPTQPVYVPPAQAFTTQIAPAVPSSSAGDGSLAVDPIIPMVPGTITVTLDLNGVLHVISLPTLPVIPTL